MRFLNTEQQDIVVFLTNAGVPATGLTVSLAMRKVSDGSDVTPGDPTLVSIGLGAYKFSLAKIPSISDGSLFYRVDGSSTLSDVDRFDAGLMTFGGYPDTLVDGVASIVTTVNSIALNNVNGIGRTRFGIDHDYGGTDNLRVLDDIGAAVPNADINIFLKSDWDAGASQRTDIYRNTNGAQSITGTDGRWSRKVNLDPGTYVMVVQKQGHTDLLETEFTVT